MNPHAQFCPNEGCWAYGRAGEGHIVVHSRREQRYQCQRCRRTFSATQGTALSRVHKPAAVVVRVVTLLAHGCPVQALVAAFGLDERTVARWQADELRVRIVGGVLWLASAVTVRSRLWVGGVIGEQRDGGLLRALLRRVRACGATQAVLLCSDGLASYPAEARRVLREPARTGRPGRPPLVLPAGVLLAQAVKQRVRRRVVGVTRRIVRGPAAAVRARLIATQGQATAVVNTAFIERLNATFRARLAPLVRRTRAAVREAATLEAGMWLVGACYNFCCPQRSLRLQRGAADPPGGKWLRRTPAQAAGLTDHRWSMHELLTFPVPPKPPKRRGRRPKWLAAAAQAA